MNFEFKDGLIWIPIKIVYEGKSVQIEKCILDTGSATTAIDIGFVSFNRKKPYSFRQLYGIGGGRQEVVSQRIDELVIDQTELQGIEIEFGNLKSDFRINGFIGNDILSRYKLIVDYIRQEIYLQR